MNDLRFACPFCGQRISAPASHAGGLVDCPACAREFTLAAPPSADPAPPAAPVVVAAWQGGISPTAGGERPRPGRPGGAPAPMTRPAPRPRGQPKPPPVRDRSLVLGLTFVGGLLAVMGVAAWLILKDADRKRVEQENLTLKQTSAMDALTQIRVQEEAHRVERERRKEAENAATRTLHLKRIKQERLQFTALMAGMRVVEGPDRMDSSVLDLLAATGEEVFTEIIATYEDDVSGNEIMDSEDYLRRNLFPRLIGNPKFMAWLSSRRNAAGGPDGGGRLPDFLLSGNYTSTGTGYWISPDGWLLTNRHVVEGASTADLRVGEKIVKARVVSTDPQEDVALLKAELSTPQWLPISEGDGVPLGMEVFTVGFPNTLIQGVAPKFTSGTISSLAGERDDRDYYQTSVPVLPGNSGGALVDAKSGYVLGIVSARLNGTAGGIRADNVSYALKSSVARRFIRGVSPAAAVLDLKQRLPTTRQEIIGYAEKATVLVLVRTQ